MGGLGGGHARTPTKHARTPILHAPRARQYCTHRAQASRHTRSQACTHARPRAALVVGRRYLALLRPPAPRCGAQSRCRRPAEISDSLNPSERSSTGLRGEIPAAGEILVAGEIPATKPRKVFSSTLLSVQCFLWQFNK